jgi:hypothetical protein
MRYVGGSLRSIENRFSFHKTRLNQGVHYNEELQKAWRTYGSQNFKFTITWCGPKHLVRAEEQKRLNYWRSRQLVYNEHPSAFSPKGAKHTAETRQQLSISSKARCTPAWRAVVSARVKQQHAQGKFGQATWSEETKRYTHIKIGNALRGRVGATLGRKSTYEQRKKYHQAALRRWQDPIHRAKRSGKNHPQYGKPSSRRGTKCTPEQCERIRQGALKREAARREQRGRA